MKMWCIPRFGKKKRRNAQESRGAFHIKSPWDPAHTARYRFGGGCRTISCARLSMRQRSGTQARPSFRPIGA